MNKIEETLELWHIFLESRDFEILDKLLDENVVFHSPIQWKVPEGKFMTMMYLKAAMSILGEGGTEFQYVNKFLADNKCVLEFTAKIDGVIINGIDMIECNHKGKIVSFKVMIRPLKAINKMLEKMAEILESFK
jgi:hypothetical protein